ncbi:phage tail spike protein [Ligilactobacillus aviarius]|uniref:phage tail spike protein n=1 Tax=Ligilactobacillus aviarius TaxID=1606 RepID=UPI0025A4B9EB|nr:phage tail spike protein [Ligilactobacillus aviarius]MDM8277852.1 phage tail spike protein [Ligilactobacillus aviarius]
MKFFLLDKQQNIIGRLSEEYILEATFTEEINTAGELLITLPAKKRLSGNVIHVLITNPSKDHSYLMFKIIKETVKDEEVEYTAVESAYDELTSYGYIQDKRPTANAQTIAEMILKDTRWHVREIPDTSEAFISFYYLSVLDCLKKIVQTFDFEIGFDVLINDDENQITDRRVNFYIKQGEQTGKRFEYGSNLLSIKQEQDTQNIYTALVGRGKGVQVSGGDDDNTPDGYGRRITFADVEWSKANGDPLDKPKGQEWLEDPDATKQLGFSDGHMRIGLEVFEDVDDPKVLLQKTYEALKTAERPQVQFSASVINTGELHLGDRVGITRNDIGIAYETRVFKVQHNLLDETQNKIDLGDNLEQTNNLSYQVSALQSEVTNNTEGIITVTQSANGKNKVYYSSTMPATGSNGDVWYKDLGNGETEMYIYDNGWQLVISTENLHKIEDEIKQQQTALGQAVQDANAAAAKADGLVAQVGDANTNAQKALTTAQQNQADLAQAKNDLQNTKSQLSNVQTGLTSATANISQAQAELEAVKSQAAQQGQTIVNIQKSTDSLSSQIADVKGNVTGLQQTATSLQSAVENNKNDISVIKQTAEGVESTVTNMKISSANLLPNTFDFSNWETGGQGAIEPASQWNTQTDAFHGWIDTTKAWIRVPESMAVYLEQGKQYTYSAKVWNNGSNTENNFDNSVVKMYINSPSNSYGYTLTEKVNHTPRTYAVTFTAPETGKYTGFNTYQEGDFIGGSLWTAECMLVEGNVVTAYQPSSQDMAKNADVSTIKQDITGLEATVKSNSGNISDLKLASDKLQSTVQSNSGQISQVKQTADSLQSAVTNNSNDISTLKQTATGLQSTVSNIKASSENLLPDTLDFAGWQQGGQGNMDSAQADNTLTNAWHAWGDNNSAWIGSPQAKPVYLRAGTQYTFSAVCWNNGSLTGNNFDDDDVELHFNNNDNSRAYNHQLTSKTNKEHVRYSVTFTVDTDGLYWGFKLIDKSGFVGGSLWSAEYMLVEGNIATAYQPSSTAMATNISTIQQTIDGVKIDVANSKGDISSLKQRADSMESNISDNKNDISNLRQTANSLQSNIQSKADISQITQLSNAFQTVVQNIGPFYPDGDFSDVDLGKYYDPWDTCPNLDNFSVVTNNKDWGYYLQIYTPHGTINKAITKEYLPINAQYSLTFKGKSLLSYGGKLNSSFMVYMHFFDSNKNAIQNQSAYYKYDNNNVWQDFSLSFTPPSNAAYVRVETVLDNSNGSGIYWGALDNLSLENGGSTIASKISQMSDDINMRVQKGDLLSQINIQAGSTLIQSKKLFLDASSVVFSGNAFIPSAAITDLSADKITTGTLNAGNVNIINLNVDKLVGNTTEFVRSGWTNAYGSHVQIDGGGMAVSYGDWYTRFDGNGMTFKDGNEVLGGFTRVGMISAPSWYNGLAFNAGGDAEFLSIGAQDYGNDSQNPVPAKLLWMRNGINTYGYQPGWNFEDTVWADDIRLNHLGTASYRLDLVALKMGDETAFGLQSGNGYGFWWGANGGLGIYGGGKYVNFTHTKFINDIQMGQGGSINWSSL